MPRDGTVTRTRIMDAALDLVLDYGFGGTSIDRIIDRADVTKGAFFYHFDSKDHLARALVDRFAADDGANIDAAWAAAEAASDDPLEQVMAFLGWFEERMGQLTDPYPGCLFASYIGQAELFDDETLQVARDALARLRIELGDRLRAATQQHAMREDVDPDSLADACNVVFEGAFVMSKVNRDPEVIAEQLRHYRRYVSLLFDT